MMTKEEFLKLAAEKWDKLSHHHQTSESFYDYEKNFDELWTDFGKEALQGSLGETSQNRRKKKTI